MQRSRLVFFYCIKALDAIIQNTCGACLGLTLDERKLFVSKRRKEGENLRLKIRRTLYEAGLQLPSDYPSIDMRIRAIRNSKPEILSDRKCAEQGCLKPYNPKELLCCSICIRNFHARCCATPLDFRMVSRFPWQCNDCKICEKCKSAEDEPSMLICEVCDRTWHMQCLSPPLGRMPDGDWCCRGCGECRDCGQRLTQTEYLALRYLMPDQKRVCRTCYVTNCIMPTISNAENNLTNSQQQQQLQQPQHMIVELFKQANADELVTYDNLVNYLTSVDAREMTRRKNRMSTFIREVGLDQKHRSEDPNSSADEHENDVSAYLSQEFADPSAGLSFNTRLLGVAVRVSTRGRGGWRGRGRGRGRGGSQAGGSIQRGVESGGIPMQTVGGVTILLPPPTMPALQQQQQLPETPQVRRPGRPPSLVVGARAFAPATSVSADDVLELLAASLNVTSTGEAVRRRGRPKRINAEEVVILRLSLKKKNQETFGIEIPERCESVMDISYRLVKKELDETYAPGGVLPVGGVNGLGTTMGGDQIDLEGDDIIEGYSGGDITLINDGDINLE